MTDAQLALVIERLKALLRQDPDPETAWALGVAIAPLLVTFLTGATVRVSAERLDGVIEMANDAMAERSRRN